VRIVAALVIDVGRETVTLLNTGVQALDPAGWALLDAREQRMPLPSTRFPRGDGTHPRAASGPARRGG
jgi:hypothetical protein